MRLAVTLERWATLCVRSAVGFDVCVQHSMDVEDDNEQRLRLNMHCRRQYVKKRLNGYSCISLELGRGSRFV